MNKRISTIALVLLVVGAALWLTKRDNNEHLNSLKTSKAEGVADLGPSQPKTETTSNSLTSSQSESLNTSSTEKETEEENTCYKNLTQQVKNNPVILENLKKELESRIEEIGPGWFIFENEPFNAPNANSGISEKFIAALAYAHMLRDMNPKGVPLDYEKSLRLFLEVHRLDPSNSAPLAMAAIVQIKNKNDLSAQNFIETIKTTTNHFDSYELNLRRKILAAVKTPSDYILLNEIAHSRPSLDVKPLLDLIQKYDAKYLALQLVTPALQTENVMPGIDWSIIQYSVGASYLNKFNPEKKLPTSIFLAQRKTNSLSLEELYPTYLKNNCNLQGLEPAIAALQKSIQKSQ